MYGILLVSNLIANERTADAEEKKHNEVLYIKNASTKLKLIIDKVNDGNAKKKVEKVYDVVTSSPVKSHPDLTQTENSILQSINELENAISINDNNKIISLADSLLSAVNERNMHLKNYN